MNENIRWTKQQQVNTLAAIDIMKTAYKADAGASGSKAAEYSQEIGAEGVVAGLDSLCAILVQFISKLTGDDRLVVLDKAEEAAKNIEITDQ